MKLYLKDSERKPDPAPIETNLRLVVVIGIALWAITLAVFVVAPATVPASRPWWPFTCIVGILLGIYAFFKVGKR
jgi:hypothetical protein